MGGRVHDSEAVQGWTKDEGGQDGVGRTGACNRSGGVGKGGREARMRL